MTIRIYSLGKPRPATLRGGDCWAHDLRPDPITGEPHPITERPHVHGAGHAFRQPEHCVIQNGLLRLYVNAGSPPSLTMQVHRNRVVIDDVYVDTYEDLYGGSLSGAEWVDAGVVTIDAPSLGVVLTGVRLVDVNPERVTIKLLAPLIGDAFVTLHRGWRSFRIQHGNESLAVPAPVSVARRVRLTDSPSAVGIAAKGRVEEQFAAIDGMYRFVSSTDPVTVDAGEFSVTSDAVTTADFGVGVGIASTGDRPYNLHQQFGDASRPLHLTREAP